MREDVAFKSGPDHCAAWWYPSSQAGPAPCVVMAHGFSLTREDGLGAYAEAFQAAGSHVLVFDHRYLGASGGEPRQRFRIADQQQDWHNAISYATARDGVDPAKLVLWGYSFSGGHVASLLAAGTEVAAAMLLCPFLDGRSRVLASSPRDVVWILPRALADLAGRPNLIPVTGQPGQHAAMNLPGEADGFAASVPAGSPWRNEISPGLFATVALFRPVTRAAQITTKLWVGRCAEDISVDGKAVARFARRAPNAEFHELPGDHFAPFQHPGSAAIAQQQVAFLTAAVA